MSQVNLPGKLRGMMVCKGTPARSAEAIELAAEDIATAAPGRYRL